MWKTPKKFSEIISAGPGDPSLAVRLLHSGVDQIEALAARGGRVHISPDTLLAVGNRLEIRPPAAVDHPAELLSQEEINPEAFGPPGLSTCIYRFGILNYQHLKGRDAFNRAFPNYDRQMWLQWHLDLSTAWPPLDSRETPGLTGSLARLVAKMIDKDPQQRYQTLVDLRDDLNGVMREMKLAPDWLSTAVGVVAVAVLAVLLVTVYPSGTVSKPLPVSLPDTLYTSTGSMKRIPAGKLRMGSGEMPNESPAHTVSVDAFYIDEFETTFRDYARFAHSTGRTMSLYPAGYAPRERHPVWNVSWSDAGAYCAAAGKRLPFEKEWERAARGLHGNRYPWGDAEPAAGTANIGTGVIAEVGSFPRDRSEFGVADLAGNVPEWVADIYGSYMPPGGGEANRPPLARTVRGGGFFLPPSFARVSARVPLLPDLDAARGAAQVGFRCACDAAAGALLRQL